MRSTAAAAWAVFLFIVILAGHGLAVPANKQGPDADRSSGWPDLWGVLRAIRDTTAVSPSASATSTSNASNTTDDVPDQPIKPDSTRSTFGQVTKQVTDRVANMFQSVRTTLWQLTGTVIAASETPSSTQEDLDTDASSDVVRVLDKEVVDKREPADIRQGDTPVPAGQSAQSFLSSAIERVRGAGRTFTEMGRTMGRWGKAMADSVVGTTVNSAVGTMLQVIKGGKPDDDADHVCFPELGCFSMLEPWTSSKRPLPRMNAPEDIQTRFFLHTRNATAAPFELVSGNDTVSNATALLLGVRTFVVVHGFNDKTSAAWVQELKDELLAKLDCNVILADWALGAQASRNYLQAASNTRIVGAELAKIVEVLSGQELLPMESVHVIGHSLGAHAAGYAGKQLGGRLGRITALDAAQPAFEDQVPEVRVAAGDALFVDVVHTNGVPFIPTLGLGLMQPVGDVDFYLNGGTVQPGCFVPKLPAVQSLVDLAALPVSVLGDMLSCSHRRAIEYFIEAVRSDCLMWGRRRAEDDLDAEGDGDKRTVVTVYSSSDSRHGQQTPWWSPPGGLTALLASFWSGDKQDKTPPTEAPSSTGPGRPSKGFSFSFPFFANVFSSESRYTDTNKSVPVVKHRDKEVRPVDGNSIADTKGGAVDYPVSAPDDSLPADTAPATVSPQRAGSASTPLTPATPQTPFPPPGSWCQDDCLPLGLDTDRYGLTGTFNVITADHSPYCMSQESNEVK